MTVELPAAPRPVSDSVMSTDSSRSARPATLEPTEARRHVERLERHIGRVVRGKPREVRLAVVSLLAHGHVLIEDVPGIGKTTLAHTLAKSLDLSFQRIQFTSDLLPSDIVGVSLYNQKKQEFEFVAGPIFAHVVLADEINRATPKTQSAMLEAMGEGKVSVERRRYTLPDPFLVLATQNPLEYQGTFPLPESQLDRFLISLHLGYPPAADERELLLSGGVDAILQGLGPALDKATLQALQLATLRIEVAPKIADYILALAEATRTGGDFALGASTRGTQGLFRAAQALALCEGRGFVIPDDVKRLTVPVFAHRVMLRHGGGGLDEARAAVERVLARIAVPL